MISKDFSDISEHPDDVEDGDSASSSCDSLSELSAATVPFAPQIESLKDQKLQRLVVQMKMGIKGHGGVAPEKKSTPVQPAQNPDVAAVPQKKDEKELQAMGEQLKILVEKATRHAQSKQGIQYMQELPGHVSWIN